MVSTNVLSDQQIFTLYAIGTFLTVFLTGVLLAGVLGVMMREGMTSPAEKGA